MANKRITLTLDESLVKTFEDEYGDLKTWLKSEFLLRARMSKKRIIDTKIKEIIDSTESLEIPLSEEGILAKYFEDKKVADEKALAKKKAEGLQLSDSAMLKDVLKANKVANEASAES